MIATVTIVLLGLVGYVYVGYPLLAALWARTFPRPVAMADIEPTVSLVIAAYNEAGVIEEKITNSLALDYPRDRLQIIVVADGSSDATADVARGFEDRGVLVLHMPQRRGKSAALNRGVAHAVGEVLVLSDANAFYRPDAIRKLVRNLADPQVGLVSGNKTVRHGSSRIADQEGSYWKYESFIKKAETRSGSTVGVVGEINAIRRGLYPEIPEHIINDDAYLCLAVLRRGLRVVYEPEAISCETPAQSMGEEVARRKRMVAGRYQQMLAPGLWTRLGASDLFKLASHKLLRLLLPFLMIGALLANVLAVLAGEGGGLLVLTLAAQLAAYALAGLGMLVRGSSGWARLPKAAFYIVSSNLAVLDGVGYYLSGRASVLWKKAAR